VFIALAGALWSPATAQDDEIIIKVRVQDTSNGNGRNREPVPGAAVVVTDADGNEVATGETDATGVVDIPVPAEGTYTVTLDPASLPEGLAPADGQGTREVNARTGLGGNANFNLAAGGGGGGGGGGDGRSTKLDLLPQTIANGIRFGLVIAITSVGLSLIYGTTGLSNFAHGEIVTFGAVIAWWVDANIRIFDSRSGVTGFLQLAFSALLGMAAAAAFGSALERGVWRPMRRRRIGLTSMMIVSIGIAIFARFLIQFRYGGQGRSYREFASQRNVEFLSIGLTPRDMFAVGISVATLLAVAYMLLRTRVGKAVRAVSDNPDLASSSGIDTDGIIMFVWILGGALAGLGGVLYGLDEQVRWNMGSNLLLLMFAAITLGGLGRPFGALVGSLAIGLFVQLWAWWFSTLTDLKNLGALIALIVILLVRPQGILGRKERIG